MGFLKKIGKSLRKGFKKVGKGIKKAFAKFGKFMGKIGILGQLAMMFILPGIGGALLKGFGAMAGNMAALTGKFAGLAGNALGTIVKGVGTVLKGAHGFVQTGINAFKTVTSGIMEFGKTALNKIPGVNISGAKANFFGSEGVFEGIKLDSKRIFDPFKSNITIGKGMSLESMSKTTGLSEGTLQKLNPQMDFANLKQGTNINLDFNQVSIDKAAIAGQVNNISKQAIFEAGADAPKVSDYDLNIHPDQAKSLNYDVGSLDSAGQQFNYTTTGEEFPMGGYSVDTVTAQTGKLTPSLLDGVPKMQTETLGFETEFGFPKPIEGQFNIDLTKQTTDAFNQPRFEGAGISMDSQSLLAPKDSSSFMGNMGQRVKDTFVGLPGKIGESVVNTGVTALTDRIIFGKPTAPKDPSYSQGVIPAQPFQISPAEQVTSFQQKNGPFGYSAFLSDSLGIYNWNMGSDSYRRRMQ